MRAKRSAEQDKSWKLLETLVLGGTCIWQINVVVPGLMVAGAFFTEQTFGTDCSETNFESGDLAQVVFIVVIMVAMLAASYFMAPLKAAEQGRDLDIVRIRTEGLQWLVVATTGVGGACLALAGTVNICTWVGAGIVFVGFFWGVGGAGAILLHCALVQVRLIEAEGRRKLSDQERPADSGAAGGKTSSAAVRGEASTEASAAGSRSDVDGSMTS